MKAILHASSSVIGLSVSPFVYFSLCTMTNPRVTPALLQAQGIVQPPRTNNVRLRSASASGSEVSSRSPAKREPDSDSDVEEVKPKVEHDVKPGTGRDRDVKPKYESVKSDDGGDEGLGSESEGEEDLEDLQVRHQHLYSRSSVGTVVLTAGLGPNGRVAQAHDARDEAKAA